MTFAEACLWALIRSLLLAIVAWPVSRAAARGLCSSRHSRLIFWALVLPFLMPGMFVGYAYNGWVLYLAGADFWNRYPSGVLSHLRHLISTHEALLNEILLDFLLLARLVPVGAAVARYWPAPSLTATAAHLRRMSLPGQTSLMVRWKTELDLFLRHSFPSAVPAIGLMFLLGFQEFELAARLSRPAWTVWLIDAQATGLTLTGSLARGCWPALCELAVLGGVLAVTARVTAGPGNSETSPVSISGRQAAGLILFLLAAILFVCVIPAVWIGSSFATGFVALWRQTATGVTLLREIAVGLLVAGLAAAGALAVAGIGDARRQSPTVRGLLAAVAVPGLLGGLLTSLGLLELGRHVSGGGGLIRDVVERSVFPWMIGQFLLLVPRALCLVALVRRSEETVALHTARLLAGAPDAARARRGASLIWRLSQKRRLAAWWLLWYSAYLDLATGQLLAPPGMASAPVTLYIQMHYGRNAVLSAMTVLTMIAPVLLAGWGLELHRRLFRRGV